MVSGGERAIVKHKDVRSGHRVFPREIGTDSSLSPGTQGERARVRGLESLAEAHNSCGFYPLTPGLSPPEYRGRGEKPSRRVSAPSRRWRRSVSRTSTL